MNQITCRTIYYHGNGTVKRYSKVSLTQVSSSPQSDTDLKIAPVLGEPYCVARLDGRQVSDADGA